MKILAIIFFIPFTALGSIQGSPFSPRHQLAIANAVQQTCGLAFSVNYLSHSQYDERVDQGIVDTHYSTLLVRMIRIDQGVFDYYRVTVRSSFLSQYDHDAQDWGVYTVDSVTCETH